MDCGAETREQQGYRYLQIDGVKSSSDLIAGYFEQAGDAVSALPVTSRGCVALSGSQRERGYILVKSLESQPRMALREVNDTLELHALSLSLTTDANYNFTCPRSGANDQWYSNRGFELPLAPQASFFMTRYVLHPADQKGSKDFHYPKETWVDFGLNEDGAYTLDLETYDYSRYPSESMIQTYHCPMTVDRTAPLPLRAMSNVAARRYPGELIDLRAIDISPYQVFVCWQDLQKAATCQSFTESATSTVAPRQGNWDLQYYYVDAAGNRSATMHEGIALFDTNAVENAQVDIRNAKALYERGESLQSLFSLTKALKKKMQLATDDEKRAVGDGALLQYLRLNMTGIVSSQIKSPDGNPYIMIRGGFLKEDKSGLNSTIEIYDQNFKFLRSQTFPTFLTVKKGYLRLDKERIISSSRFSVKVYDLTFKLLVERPLPLIPAFSGSCSLFTDDDLQKLALNCPILLPSDSDKNRFYVTSLEPESKVDWKRISTVSNNQSQTPMEFLGNQYILAGMATYINTADGTQRVYTGQLEQKHYWHGRICLQKAGTMECYKDFNFDQSEEVFSQVYRSIASENSRYLGLQFVASDPMIVDLETLKKIPVVLKPDEIMLNLSAPSATQDDFILQTNKAIYRYETTNSRLSKLLDLIGDMSDLSYWSRSTACALSIFKTETRLLVFDVNQDNGLQGLLVKPPQVLNTACESSDHGNILRVQTSNGQVYSFASRQSLRQEYKIEGLPSDFVSSDKLEPSPQRHWLWDENYSLASYIYDLNDQRSLKIGDDRSIQTFDSRFAEQYAVARDRSLEIISYDGNRAKALTAEPFLKIEFIAADKLLGLTASGLVQCYDTRSGQLITETNIGALPTDQDWRPYMIDVEPAESVDLVAIKITPDNGPIRLNLLRKSDLRPMTGDDRFFPQDFIHSMHMTPDGQRLVFIVGTELLEIQPNLADMNWKVNKRGDVSLLEGIVGVQARDGKVIVLGAGFMRTFSVGSTRPLRIESLPTFWNSQFQARLDWVITDTFNLEGPQRLRIFDVQGNPLFDEGISWNTYKMIATEEAFYFRTADRIIRMDIDEKEVFKRSCAVLKDFLQTWPDLEAEDRTICDATPTVANSQGQAG